MKLFAFVTLSSKVLDETVDDPRADIASFLESKLDRYKFAEVDHYP